MEASEFHRMVKAGGMAPCAEDSISTVSETRRPDLSAAEMFSEFGPGTRSFLSVNEHVSRLEELAARYADRRPDLADLCLIRLSELHPRHPVITTDLADFRVYRRAVARSSR